MNKYKYILVLIIVSILVQLFVQYNSLKETIINVLFQFIASWLLGYGFTQFYNKYYSSSYLQWWATFYLIMVTFAILDTLILK